MTTVAVTDRLTFVDVLHVWAAGGRQVVPRSVIFPPGKSDDQVREENTQQFAGSETNAEARGDDPARDPDPGRGRRPRTRLARGRAPLQVGDELVAVSGRAVGTPAAVSDALASTTPGQNVTRHLPPRRPGAQARTSRWGRAPTGAQGLLGVRPAVEPRAGDIKISLGDIGGPSAGLMFALAVVDKLSPGELTGGRFIAGTGSIDAVGERLAHRGHPVQDGGRP